MMARLVSVILFGLLFLLTHPAFAVPATAYTGSVSYGNDSNLTLGYLKADILSDDYFNAAFDISHTIMINSMNKLVLSATATTTSFGKYDGINHTDIDLKASYVFQLSNRFRSPQFRLYFLTGNSDYKVDLRDNTHSQYGATISFRIDDRTLLRAGFSSESVDADATFDPISSNTYQTFDTERETTYLGINITQTEKLSLYASISLINGDIVANWRDSTFASDIPVATQIAWETIPDTTFANSWRSTKYNADITKLAFGFNYAFNPANAIDAVIESLDADAGNYSYTIDRFSLSYLHRF